MSSVSGQAPNVFKGFTLVEVLVTLSIVAMISIIGTLSFQSFSNISKVRGERDKMMNRILDIRSNALNNKLEPVCSLDQQRLCTSSNPCSGGTCNFLPSDGGYGMYVDLSAKKYIIFADRDSGYDYDSGETLAQGEYSLPSDISFKNPVQYYDEITNQWKSISVSSFRILFRPNEGNTAFRVDDSINNYIKILEIGIKDTQGNFSYININKYTGLAYAQESSLPTPPP